MIDWARVAEFYDEVGAEDFDEVVELFLEEVVEAMERKVEYMTFYQRNFNNIDMATL